MTIPYEILNYNTLPNVVKNYWSATGNRTAPMSEEESICLDAVLSTGITRKQGVSKTMKYTQCPPDSLRWIVGMQMPTTWPDTDPYSVLCQWHNDPPSVSRERFLDLLQHQRAYGPSHALICCIVIHQYNINPFPWDARRYSQLLSQNSPYRGLPCYGLVREALGQTWQRTNDLLRLLTGHLPEPPHLARVLETHQPVNPATAPRRTAPPGSPYPAPGSLRF